MFDSIKELAQRFSSDKPPTDPDRRRDRADQDGVREMFARAESAAMVGPPIDATLEPVSAPENVQMRTRGAKQLPDVSGGLNQRGASRGLESAKAALVKEAGWSEREAERIKMEVQHGEMTEQQLMRIVEGELGRSETTGRMFGGPTPKVEQSEADSMNVPDPKRKADNIGARSPEELARGVGRLGFGGGRDE